MFIAQTYHKQCTLVLKYFIKNIIFAMYLPFVIVTKWITFKIMLQNKLTLIFLYVSEQGKK